MSEQFYTILTKIGKAKIANSAALGNQVNLVKFQIGDGNGAYYSPSEDQTQLKNKVWEGNISSVRIDDENPNWIVLETLIPGTDGGFMVREAAAVDNEGNLIAIGKYPETYKPVAGDGSIKDLIIKMIIEVSNTSAVTLKVDPTVILATKNDILSLDKKISKNTSDIKVLTNRIDNLKLVDTKVKLTDPDNIFGLGEDANVNQALLSNKTSILEVRDIANSAKQRGDEVKQILVDKLISEGLNVSTSELFEELINEIELEKHNLPKWYQPANLWFSCDEMAHSTWATSSAIVDDIIYTFGYSSGNFINFDTNTGIFYDKPNKLTNRNRLTSSVVDGLIYFIGGYAGNYSNKNESYNPKTDEVIVKANMPTARQGLTSSVVDKSIYCIAGGQGVDPYGINEVYDTVTNTWSTKSSCRNRDFACSSTVDGLIYVIGGGYNGNMLSDNECYNPITNTWTRKTSLPSTKIGAISEVVDGIIYCIGGTSVSANSTCVYNPVTNTWTTKANMTQPRMYCSSAVAGKNIYVFGGHIQGSACNKAEFYIV
ncbi:phage tail protein [Romboutsia lituseburensis]|uniref:phage tail-collar fiber domain-containing protein n=1 Tax=Romboutsia lituseburensis TaxID=1537 RepID=UPI0022EB66A6|nr:phage tail protein [Romboutsia lituseburensis]